MRLARLLGLAVVMTGVFFAAFAAKGDGESIQYVEVKKHLSNVYLTNTDPKPDQIVRQVRKSEYIELLSQGDSWYKVRVDGRDGFLEARNGKVVNKKSAREIMLLLYVVLLIGCIGGVLLYMKKRQSSPSASAADDDDLDDIDDD